MFGDKLGRKNTLRVGSAISAFGGILQAAAVNFPMLMAGRVISGLGNGKATEDRIPDSTLIDLQA